MRKFFKEMFSEGTASSCMRFCVTIVVITYMFNWTAFNLINHQLASFELKDLIGLLGVLAMKLGQKKLENGGK
ncbi:MAG: hypothetical protein JRI72_17300 [Deltaproteobacteria bacterium]|nr:hypothetical protein [Deltaproteobacteria bacterium]